MATKNNRHIWELIPGASHGDCWEWGYALSGNNPYDYNMPEHNPPSLGWMLEIIGNNRPVNGDWSAVIHRNNP